jgi:hypothetical protein
VATKLEKGERRKRGQKKKKGKKKGRRKKERVARFVNSKSPQ